jgi:hypothetical protein
MDANVSFARARENPCSTLGGPVGIDVEDGQKDVRFRLPASLNIPLSISVTTLTKTICESLTKLSDDRYD